jgi:D-lactate dehydrogenase
MMEVIAFFETEPWEREYFRARLADAELQFQDGVLDTERVPARTDAEIISVFINSTLTPAVLDCFPRLKFIATRSTGYDHVDVAACRSRGITVANVPTYGARTVAEFTFALMLAVVKKVRQAADRVRDRGSFDLTGLRGFDLRGKTLGVIGTGHIGREVIRIAHGLDMNVLATDAFPNADAAVRLGFRYVPLDELLAGCDIITLHVPYLPATHHLLNRENLKKTKRGAVLINTARGAVVDTAALIEALDSGQLSGAGLDVLEEEGAVREERELLLRGHPEERHLRAMLRNHLLIRMENVVVTPHNAFNTTEALEEILRVTVENIQAYRKGTPVNPVT